MKNNKIIAIIAAIAVLLTAVVCVLVGLFITIAAGTPAGATVVVVNIVVYALFSLVGLVRK